MSGHQEKEEQQPSVEAHPEPVQLTLPFMEGWVQDPPNPVADEEVEKDGDCH